MTNKAQPCTAESGYFCTQFPGTWDVGRDMHIVPFYTHIVGEFFGVRLGYMCRFMCTTDVAKRDI